MSRALFAFATLVLTGMSHVAAVAAVDTFDPAEYAKPTQCPAFHDFKGGACVPQVDQINGLPKKACVGPGLKLFGDSETCVATDRAPEPECKPLSGRRSRLSGSGEAATCTYESQVPVSGLGDYIGDCIDIKVRPKGRALKPGHVYQVTAQEAVDTYDRKLTLVEATTRWHGFWFGCRTKIDGSSEDLLASELNASGATRSGFAFGALTMPYKYFVGDKSFVTQVPIGAYLGWRSGQAGSGLTTAVAFTLGSVKADTVDPSKLDASGKPTVTGNTDVAALSLAAGVMFDILKSPAAKPFKAGIFAGRDVVSNDPTIAYRFNRKTWIALQIGYDFTDN